MKATTFRATAAVAFFLTSVAGFQQALAQTADAGLRPEIDALKQGQEAIRKDLDEIKTLLQARPAAPARPGPTQAVEGTVGIGDLPFRGKKDAPLTLVEFSDYQCPFCKRYTDQTEPELFKDYVESGKLRYVFRDFPLESIHSNALKAAEAARCAGEQGKYWEMHAQLFANQQALEPDKLVGYAEKIGLKKQAFSKCLDDGTYADAVRRDVADASKLGVTGTPAFFLGMTDGNEVKDVVRITGAQPVATFKAEIDKRLASPAAAIR